EDFSISYGGEAHPAPAPLADLFAKEGVSINDLVTKGLTQFFSSPVADGQEIFADRWKRIFPQWQDLQSGTLKTVGWLDRYATHPTWTRNHGLADIARVDHRPILGNDTLQNGFHYPVTVTLSGRTIPGYFIDHHICHGASSFYRSGYEEAGIITHDGGDPARNLSGYFLLGQGHSLKVIAPHQLGLGGLYRSTGVTLGFDAIGAEGKLMGLSSYGRPRFFDAIFTGNVPDMRKQLDGDPFQVWFGRCLRLAKARGYDIDYGHRDKVTNPLSIDIAASTQKLFGDTLLSAARTLETVLRRAGVSTDKLCLSGGAALNCPANSQLYCDGPFTDLFIEPNCDDGGLSTGAALYAHHTLLGHDVDEQVARKNRSPYQGITTIDQAPREAADQAARDHHVEPLALDQAAERAAEDLAADKLVAWVEGASEVGPRALCHRSLLANPLSADAWPRTNTAKGREQWRPFAPAVLADQTENWFADCPMHSPYMLFTGRVRARELPAITHVDGSARIQTVDADNGAICPLIQAFGRKTGVPVVLNTSLNGPGEPIVETAEEALALFEKGGIDVLYLAGLRISRQTASSEPAKPVAEASA
ncbi:MAG: carbamoyltransferase C-terminal domain-containing protein, partial [Pseudomonadota bacterium]